MESRQKQLTRTHSLQGALKVKDSKTGQMILKGNVLEESKLEEEISQINHWQRKEENRLRWEKEFAIKGFRKKMLKRGKSIPDVLQLRLPPIGTETTIYRKLPVERTQSTDERVHKTLAYRLSSDDSSPERSPYNSLENMFVKPRLREQARRNTTSLPALISPHLMRKASSMNDPRFTNLIRQLVPNNEVVTDSYETEGEQRPDE